MGMTCLKQCIIQKEQRRQKSNCQSTCVNSKTLPNLDPLANHHQTSTRGQLSFRYRPAITRPSSQSGQAVESLHNQRSDGDTCNWGWGDLTFVTFVRWTGQVELQQSWFEIPGYNAHCNTTAKFWFADSHWSVTWCLCASNPRRMKNTYAKRTVWILV